MLKLKPDHTVFCINLTRPGDNSHRRMELTKLDLDQIYLLYLRANDVHQTDAQILRSTSQSKITAFDFTRLFE